MPRKSISLEISAYERLKAAKRPGESFSDVVHRLLVDSRPSFSIFAGLLDKSEGAELEKAFMRMRSEDREIDGESIDR